MYRGLISTGACVCAALAMLAGCASHSTNLGSAPVKPSSTQDYETYAIHETTPGNPPTVDYVGIRSYSEEVMIVSDGNWPLTKIKIKDENGALLGFTLKGRDPLLPNDSEPHYYSRVVFNGNGRLISAVPAALDWAGCTRTEVHDAVTDTTSWECVRSATNPCDAATRYCKTSRELIENQWYWRCDCELNPPTE